MAFLTTRVKPPVEDDWGYLNKLMKYIKGKLGVKLNLRVDRLSVIKWWVYASFVTDNNLRGHTGGMMSIGSGAITSSSRNQNINGRSSTDNKLILVNDIMGPVLWALYFIQGQGYTVERNIMFQDNQSTMRLMLNGKK